MKLKYKDKNSSDKKDTELSRLKLELKKQEKTAQDFKNKFLRALADYQNYEKRVIQEKDALKQNANRGLLERILPILDDLEKAEIFIKDPGLKLIFDKLKQVLKDEEVEEILLAGKEFDPHFAEAIEVVEGKEDNKIVEVLRKCYKFKGKILRVAQVRVSKKTEEPISKSATNSNN